VIHQQWQLWLLGWALAVALLGTLYLVQLRTRDATAVDAGWAMSVTLIAVLDAVLGPGDISHRVLIATIAGLENLRVALVVIRRLGHGEDSRYRELRRRWRERAREQLTFATFYQAQGLLAATLAVPFVLASFNHHAGLEPVEWAGAALWLVAVTFETIADEQLRRFKSSPANRGTTMRSGLWRYSRHPNYFFQSLTWIAYALVACAAPWGWIGFLAPALILYFVLFVTGIPPSEEEALRHRGDDYRRYQRETSAFIPWFPRNTEASRAR
jgi:steroid 5-alpha reductase family enzyme